MLHTLPPSLISMHSKQLLHFEKYKKITEVPTTFCSYFSKVSNGKNFHFSSNFGLETHPAVLREYAFYPPPPVQPGSHPPFFLIPLLCIVLCIMYFTCKDAPIMYARHSLYADQVSLGSSWASQANA